MTIAKPIVAVVPFGARGRDGRAGAVGRQLARRLVDRFAGSPDVELRPVFLVAMGETKCDSVAVTGAEYVTAIDPSCLMHVQGILGRRKDRAQTIHLASILASEANA